MTFWSLTNSDFPTNQTFHQILSPWYRAWPSPIMSGFHGAFATGVACQQGTLTLPDTWFRPPFWDLLMLQLLRPNSSNLPCLYSTFHLEYPLVLSRFCFWMIVASWFTCSFIMRVVIYLTKRICYSFSKLLFDLETVLIYEKDRADKWCNFNFVLKIFSKFS